MKMPVSSFIAKKTMDAQPTANDNSDSVLRLSGAYSTTATLGFDGYDQSVLFSGGFTSERFGYSFEYIPPVVAVENYPIL